MIVVPAIDLRGGRCVRLVRGDPSAETEYGTDPVAVGLRFERDGAELLHVVDLDAALEVGDNGAAVRAICRAVSIPVQVGGGIRSSQAVERTLAAGAARAILGTAALRDPDFARAAASRFGDRIVGAVDVRAGRAMLRGWREEGPPVEEAVVALAQAGVARFLVTAVDADGTLGGPDLELYRQVLALTDRPLLASGGISSEDDLGALAALGVEGAVVGTALYEGRLSLAAPGGARGQRRSVSREAPR